MTAGDDIRAWGERVIQGAMEQAGDYYVGKVGSRPGKTSGRNRQNPKTAPVQNHFKQGNADRYGYPPLSPGYEAQKAKDYPGKPIMVATGALGKSTQLADVDASLQSGMITIAFVASPAYGAYHFNGSGNNPRRDWATPDAKDLEDIVGVMQDFIDTQSDLENADSKRRGKSAQARFT